MQIGKIAQEAFCEAFHVNATHPQIMAYLGDTNSQVDVWDNFARVISPGGTPSPLLEYDVSEEDQLRAMLDTSYDKELPITIPEGTTMRPRCRYVPRPMEANGRGLG